MNNCNSRAHRMVNLVLKSQLPTQHDDQNSISAVDGDGSNKSPPYFKDLLITPEDL